jgi:hypothetical protein
MAEYVAFLHLRDDAPIDVKVRPANCARRDFDDGIAWMFDFRLRNFLAPDIGFAVPSQSFHGGAPCAVGDPSPFARNAYFLRNAHACDSVQRREK